MLKRIAMLFAFTRMSDSGEVNFALRSLAVRKSMTTS
jgi:hypothetical protein